MDSEVLQDKLIEYLESNDLKYIIRDGKISHNCLDYINHQDSSPSAFTILGDEPFSHCSSCNFHLNTEQLYNLLDLGLDPNLLFQSQINNMLKKFDKNGKNKEQELAPVFLPIEEGKFAKSYRGISPDTYQKVGAFYTIPDTYYAKRIIIPVYDVDTRLRGFEAVSTSKKVVPKILRPKGINTENLFGFENLIESDTVFICEGIFNALSFIECDYSAVFNFGLGSIKPKIKKLLMKGIKNVILVGDNDEAGRRFAKECYYALKNNFNVAYFSYPYEFKDVDKFDANDLLKRYTSAKFRDYVDRILEKNMIKIKRK